jgi:3-hydroxyisobutyrate dehydrogenase
MGSIFSQRAVRANLQVTAWDRTPDRQRFPPSEGIHVVRSVAEAVAGADAVVSMLFDAQAIFDVMDEQGGFQAMKSGATWLQMSTIGIDATERAIRLCATRPEICFVDAPVSGSKSVAEAGNIVVFASGERERTSAAVQPFFEAIAREVHWLGVAGQGTRMGLLFNAWTGTLIQNIAEVMILAEALRVDPARFVKLMSQSDLVPPWALHRFEKIFSNRTSEIDVPLRLVAKNVHLALSAAGAERTHLPILDQVAATWADAIRDTDADVSALYLSLKSL